MAYIQCVVAIFYQEGRQGDNLISDTALSEKGYLNIAIAILFFAEKMVISLDKPLTSINYWSLGYARLLVEPK